MNYGYSIVRANLRQNIEGQQNLDDAQRAALLEREFLYCLIEGDHPELMQDENWVRHRTLPRGGPWDEVIARCKQMAATYRAEGEGAPDFELERFDAPPPPIETEEETQERERLEESRAWALQRGLMDSF